ncbi:restriction endonuclease subunit S [Providencia rettgeri]
MVKIFPNDWVSTKLEIVVEILDAMRIPVNNNERQSRIEGKLASELFPYYGATGEVGKIDGYLFNEELVALGEDGVPFFDHLKTKAYLLTGKTWVNNHAHVLKGWPNGLNNKLLLHYLNQFDYQGYVNGGTRLKLTQSNMRTIPVPLPSLAEQKSIVDKLNTLLTKVEQSKARLERISDLLKAFRQSVLSAAVSGKLTEKWREEHSTLNAISLTEIDSYWSSQYIKFGKKRPNLNIIAPISSIQTPKSWLNTNIGYIFDVYVGATPSRTVKDYWEGSIPWVSSSEVAFCRITSTKETISALGLSKTSTNLHPPGTVMLAMIGQGKTRGQVAILDIQACHNQNTAALRVPTGLVISEYLYFYLVKQYEETRRIGGGNNQQALNKSFVQSLEFLLPPFKEQQEIVRRIEELFTFADSIEQKANAALERVNNLTQSILAKAFRGELTADWRAANPDLISGENSAESLLEKIKAERKALEPAKKTRARKNV